MNLKNNKQESKQLQHQLEKLNEELKSCKESKSKLEALYKIKCKSDLNKSAHIKKLELNYEQELMKFRNEFNYDLVRHLESQLSLKDSQLLEQNNQLDNVVNLVERFNVTFNLSQDFLNNFNYIKDSLKQNKTNLNVENIYFFNQKKDVIYKKAPVNVLFNRIDENTFDSSKNPSEMEKIYEKNLQLQDQIGKLDKQLLEMKTLNKRLVVNIYLCIANNHFEMN
jgi:hypothetical protein